MTTMNPEQRNVADALRQHANDLLSAAGRSDEADADVAMTPDEARKLASVLLLAAEAVGTDASQDQPVGGAPDSCRGHLLAARAYAALIAVFIDQLATDRPEMLPDDEMRDDAGQLVEAIEAALARLDELGLGSDDGDLRADELRRRGGSHGGRRGRHGRR
jgi:hypothetical protein